MHLISFNPFKVLDYIINILQITGSSEYPITGAHQMLCEDMLVSLMPKLETCIKQYATETENRRIKCLPGPDDPRARKLYSNIFGKRNSL